MPHKRNPIVAQQLIRGGRLTRGYVDLVLDGAVADHDRATAAWSREWHAINPALAICGGSARGAADLVAGLEVDADAMKHNLGLTGGLIMAEAVMMRLSPEMGRKGAHDAVDELVERSLGCEDSFASLVAAEYPETADALKPENYLGHSDDQIDATLEHAEAVLMKANPAD